MLAWSCFKVEQMTASFKKFSCYQLMNNSHMSLSVYYKATHLTPKKNNSRLKFVFYLTYFLTLEGDDNDIPKLIIALSPFYDQINMPTKGEILQNWYQSRNPSSRSCAKSQYVVASIKFVYAYSNGQVNYFSK